MASPYKDSKGNHVLRKRLPDDVRAEYGRLYGPRHEAKRSIPAGTKPHVVKQLAGEFIAEVEGRIAHIRAELNGESVSLTERQARTLAGQWYVWFLDRYQSGDLLVWQGMRERVQAAIRDAVSDKEWDEEDPDILFRDREDVREAVRPVLADIGETSQFLAQRRLVLDPVSRNQFLDFVYDDLAEALRRRADRDHSEDKYRERFPKFDEVDHRDTPIQLFERWVREQKPAASTVETWRYVFRAMEEKFSGRSAASIGVEEARQWIANLITDERSAATVDKNWLTASKTVFGWAARHKHISRNPFANVPLTIPKKAKLREKAFRADEYRAILKAALEATDTGAPFGAAKRWVPWLCAYTGARAGEITQLRKKDIVEREGIYALNITPEAGSVKDREARIVPLHQDLIDQGFLRFVAEHSEGPLFYTPDPNNQQGNLLTSKKPRSVQVRQRLAKWVRELGITDKEVQPNHAWRYTFKQIAARNKIEEAMRDYITGHAPATIGRSYTVPNLEDMAEAMKRFPKYQID
jgi:integrase